MKEKEKLNENEQLALKIAEELSEGHEFKCDSLDIYKGAMRMAAWKEQQMIEKAVEFLKNYRQYTTDGFGYIPGIVNDQTIEDFKKYMED